MKKFFDNQVVRAVLCTFVLTVCSLAFLAPVSCRLTEEGLDISPADTTAPAVEKFLVDGSTHIKISCSEKIVLDKVSVFEVDGSLVSGESDYSSLSEENAFALANCMTYSEDGKSVEIDISEPTEIGKEYIFSGRVYDTTGNSLDFSQKFCGFNDRPARLIFNEIRNCSEKKSLKSEFIEFFVLKDGNTSGLEFLSADKGEKKKYIFPAIEVKKGDFVTLHCRTGFKDSKTQEKLLIDGAIDETDGDIEACKASESSDRAWDLWIEGYDKIFSGTDILVLRDSNSKEMKDMLLLSKNGEGEWSKKLAPFAKEAGEFGLWNNAFSQKDALKTKNATTIKRTLSRKNTAELSKKYDYDFKGVIPVCASDWILTDALKGVSLSGATPGEENSSNPYIVK